MTLGLLTTSSPLSLRSFAFPLNVYTRLLELENGHADYLHYGLFDDARMPASTAQQRASDLLWQHLPAPCKLLEVGIGLGTTLKRLTDLGYAVTGITPDAAQIAYARNCHGNALNTLLSRYEYFAVEPGSWQAILFQESAQYIDDIDLFDQADRLLAAGGEIIVMDEFLLRRDQAGPQGLHYLEHFLRLAERSGFEVLTRLDLSTQAAPTVDWLLAGTARHRETLKDELGVDDGQLDALNDSNRAYQEKYADGRYGYFLLHLKRQQFPRWHLGRIAGGRDVEMRALFAEVFGHEMSAAHWQWKYGEGRGIGIGVWANVANVANADAASGKPRLVAHYGGMTRDILYFGQPEKALQCGDVMVAGAGRGSLSRQGPVFLSAATCLEHELGYGAPHLVGFGFPNERAYRLPERLGLYADNGRMVEVAWPALKARAVLRLKLRELASADPACDALMDACWEAMRPCLGDFIVGIRDARYIRQRYLAHPDKSYRLFLLKRRFSDEVIGLLVLRLVENETTGERRCELLDVIGALPSIPLLVQHARRIAAQWNCINLFTWLTDNLLPHFALPADAVTQDLGILIPGNQWTAGPSRETLAGHWWLTSGDTDFH